MPHNPSVLGSSNLIGIRLGKVAGPAPGREWLKAFRLLIRVLGLADIRGRERLRGAGRGHGRRRLPAVPEPGVPAG
ncbi:hypothetical protein AB0L75_34625 [Streptomyces sp. NPDC052101]|uniref:hypothetical protein n=1 Tax=Streptomyces sp. NPDC052101 TaxID=3155763 RepID=UPI003437D518